MNLGWERDKNKFIPGEFLPPRKAMPLFFLLFGIFLLLSVPLGENSRGSSQVHEHIATLHSLDDSAYYFSLAFFEFAVD